MITQNTAAACLKLNCRCTAWTLGGVCILDMQFHHFIEYLVVIPSHDCLCRGLDQPPTLSSKLFLTLNKQKGTRP